ncbi:hypothetical protein WISP_106218 [Willisornis vidua]|uniref:Uncharacterized protein n=1 Tax=Willisornis vidua TaxID=1566151 RepID=A0ABQ9D2D4_9PASS|nr:hypothetical protein WISP_106218 [Willisornis vidua]
MDQLLAKAKRISDWQFLWDKVVEKWRNTCTTPAAVRAEEREFERVTVLQTSGSVKKEQEMLQVSEQQPMEVHGGADIHLQPPQWSRFPQIWKRNQQTWMLLQTYYLNCNAKWTMKGLKEMKDRKY